MAQSSTEVMGQYSPVGSFKIDRKSQMTLANQYRIYLARAIDQTTESEQGVSDHNLQQQSALARHLKRYFPDVVTGRDAGSIREALTLSAQVHSQVMLYSSVDSWPDEENRVEELVVSVAVYDVNSGKRLDIITAHYHPGVRSHLNPDLLKALDELNRRVVSKVIQ